MISDEYVQTILEVAARDASIARVLREICALEDGMRASALITRSRTCSRGGRRRPWTSGNATLSMARIQGSSDRP